MTLEETLGLHSAVFNHKIKTHSSLLLPFKWRALRTRERDYYFHKKCYIISKASFKISGSWKREMEIVNV